MTLLNGQRTLNDPTGAKGTYALLTGTHIESFPRTGGETDDAPRLGRAIASAVSTGHKTILFGSGTYTLNSLTTITTDQLVFKGVGWSTVLTNGSNLTFLDVQALDFQLDNLTVSVTDTGRTNYPVVVSSGSRPIIDRVQFSGVTNARCAGIFLQSGGDMATVHECLFNHACVRVERSDVKIDKSWFFSMTCDFAIGVYAGALNTTISNCDVVSPLVSTATGLSGIHIVGAAFNTKISDVYLDGSAPQVTRRGLYVGDGCQGTLIQNVTASHMSSDCIVLDSAYNVVVDGYSGYNNNKGGTGAREIYVTKTGTQAVANVRLTNIQCTQTAAVTGTLAGAIVVDTANVAGAQVAIEGFDIFQPGAGGAYSNPEVVADSATTSLAGRGTLSTYSARGSVAVAGGAGGVTINLSLPYPLAYQPLLSDISLVFEGFADPGHHVAFTGTNQIFVAFASGAAGPGNVHYRVDLRR